MWRAAIVFVTVVGFALRTHALADVSLRWDEGWSIALGTISWREMVRLTALDVHPPLYYALLRPWLALGDARELWVRWASVIPSVLAVPLAASAAAAWWSSSRADARRAALVAAALAAVAPAFVYYAGVARMYSQATMWLLLATWALACLGQRRSVVTGAAAVVGSLGALYTFYYSALALAGLYAAAVLTLRGSGRRILTVAALAAIGYVPWLLYAVRPMILRVAGRAGGGVPNALPLPGLLRDGMCGALLCEPTGTWVIALVLAVLGLGVAARPRGAAALSVTALPVLAVLAGAAVGAQAHMFAARYVIVATPFLILGLGWSVAVLWSRSRWLGLAAGAALVLAAAPALGGYVYAKTAEVTDRYDPSTDWRVLAPRTEPQDVAAFNILSLAGAYERYRTRDDPDWTYAQLWDPVHEPLELAKARVASAAPADGRLWLVLYRGIASEDSGALKDWADRTFFPSEGWWNDETWYQAYVTAEPDRTIAPNADLGHGMRLASAAISSRVQPGAGIGVELEWAADRRPDADARVFVHAYDPSGRLVAQHDAFPDADTRRPTSLDAGEFIRDRHGLWLPPGTSGPLRVVAGLYDPVTGTRWVQPDGSDHVDLGTVEVP